MTAKPLGVDSRPVPIQAGFHALANSIVLLLACSVVGAQERPTRRIIDVHVHAESADPRFGRTFTNPLTGQQFTASPDEATHTAQSVAEMRRLGIVKSHARSALSTLSDAEGAEHPLSHGGR